MPTGPGLQHPLPPLLHRVLRSIVVAHAVEEPRRTFPPVLHVGVPGSGPRTFEVRADERLDLALRTEVVEAMARPDLARSVVPLVWLTRMAEGPDTEDLAWAAAVGAASGELGRRLELVVVTRRAWRDPRSGSGRRWTRLRAGEARDAAS
ncbi:hypothetical protein JK386_11635 [Nocardioides sp. zg-536]|uniref:Uncharacterized protein n=1 Tax=Nocardioides faecalis TaxID=2803858 RepID=A0A939BW19_9ACTN|nr:hypothetical protein [Nocardioides faecalis]MBM9460556.1 hypothetical protein [Nocardioides faecalis]MBS4754381.1 hypothetical protein [Nocardioides faecalis]QVI57514.1 hypothetical protein KG111_10435 [Nocardioides faecalis]